MTEREIKFLRCLCEATAGTRGRRCRDCHAVGHAAGLSVFETEAAIAGLEAGRYVFTTPRGEIWLSADGAAACRVDAPGTAPMILA